MSVKKTANAPYNFVPLPDKIVYRYETPYDLPKHSVFDPELKSGVIDFSINTDTPTLVGGSSGKGDFFKIGDTFTIPGSTLRGLVRSNVKILSDSYPQYIADQRFTYREVGSRAQFSTTKAYKKKISTSVDKKINQVVKAGLIYQHGDQYYIKPLRGYTYNNQNYNFYRINDDIIESLVKDSSNSRFKPEMSLRNKGYKPYMERVAYKSVREIKILRADENAPQGYKIGYLLNSNKFGFGERQKRTHYLLCAEPITLRQEEKHIEISHSIVAAFNTQIKKNQNRANKRNESDYDEEKAPKVVFYKAGYYELPTEKVDKINLSVDSLFKQGINKAKPVFYLAGTNEKGEEQVEAFGFTPYMRLPFEYSIREGIHTHLDAPKLDYANSLFGFTETLGTSYEGYKGRVFFKNARITSKETVKTETIKKALISPRPTSFQLYLEQPSGAEVQESSLVSYNNDFQLRGYKYYWLKEQADLSSEDANHAAIMKPIVDNVKFEGQVYFENLHADELGLLLMALNPFVDGFMQLGQGKPYGFGRSKLCINALSYFNADRFISFDAVETTKKFEGESLEAEIGTLLERYETAYKRYTGKSLYDLDNTRFWAFYMAKSQVVSSKEQADYSYMTDLKRFSANREILRSSVERLERFEAYRKLMALEKDVQRAETLIDGLKSHSENQVPVVKKEVDVLVVSQYYKVEKLIRTLLTDVSGLSYVDLKNIEVGDQEVLFFNNVSDVSVIEKVIQNDTNPNRVFFYLTSYNRKIKPVKGKHIHFASSTITAKSDLLQAIGFAKKLNKY